MGREKRWILLPAPFNGGCEDFTLSGEYEIQLLEEIKK